MSPDEITDQDVACLEDAVVHAARTRDLAALRVIGVGEISMALGYPSDDPTVVCKRVAIVSPAEYRHYEQTVASYLDQLGAAGISAAATRCVAVPRSGQVAAYLVQSLLPADSIGHRVLASAAPDAEHPLLAAIAGSLDAVSDRLSIDAQVTNWSWDGTDATLLDVGTPFMWDDQGRLVLDVRPATLLFPAPSRRLVARELRKLVSRWQTPRNVATDIVANLYREGLDSWAEPALLALNGQLGDVAPISAAEARAMFDLDRKSLPLLKKLQQAERLWQTKVRRGTYDYIIADTTF